MSALNDKNEPSRFLGEGVSFKAKLIGILEVAEARGDRMCQEALADLKMAIRAAGEHKQRISVHVAIDGLRLRDEKTGDSLYHHPVHKISFIAQDMSDSRAFGYIFGSPDTGHRFFGIKTDKAASQVVIAMRDLFQVVFELKKKEIELAKQQLEGKTVSASSRYVSSANIDSSKSQNGDGSILSLRSRLAGSVTGAAASSSTGAVGGSTSSGECQRTSTSGGAVAELVDLEQELSSLQLGLHQMERLTPPSDPFGDSFTATPGFLPPPPSSARGPRTTASLTSDGGSPFSPPPARAHFNFEAPSTQSGSTVALSNTKNTPSNNTNSSVPVAPVNSVNSVCSAVPQSPVAKHQSPRRSAPLERGSAERSSLDKISLGVLERSATASPPIMDAHQENSSGGSTIFDVFTELDPLGTGRSKPYVDKKHFFQELKNPPKKVLKDLVGGISVSASTDSTFQSGFEQSSKPELLTTLTSVGRHSGGSVSISKPQVANQMFPVTSLFSSDPFAETDPFDNTDPFAESLRDDPFNGAPLDFSTRPFLSEYPSGPKLLGIGKETTLPETRIGLEETVKIKFPVSLQNEVTPLQVSLPPESSSRSPRLSKEPSSDTKSTVRQRPQSGKVQHQSQNQSQPQLRHAVPSPSPPPPLPPKKPVERVSVDTAAAGPPLPLPARRRPGGRSYSHAAMSWQPTEDDYLTPSPQVRRPVPSPTPSPSPGLDINLAQLLTCGMDELAGRLRMPAECLSKMTVAQLTSRLRDYLRTGDSAEPEPEAPPTAIVGPRPRTSDEPSEFVANFEDNFTTSESGGFVANFEGFNETERSTYDRYAVFREIEAEGFKSPLPEDNLSQNPDERDSLGSQPELPCDPTPVRPFATLSFQSTPLSIAKPCQPSIQNSKLEELKNVISNIHKTSLSPTPDIDITVTADTVANGRDKRVAESNSDRYAALRDLSAADESPRPLSADLPDDLDAGAPLRVPKERKKSDEKSDGFDHSDFFDCIDHSLSLTNPEEAFRKSPMVTKEMIPRSEKVPDPARRSPSKLSAPQPLVSGSVSDIPSGSSPEIVLTGGRESQEDDRESHDGVHLNNRRGDAAWALLGGPNPPGIPRSGVPCVDSNVALQSEDGASPWSSDSKDSPPPPLPQPKARQRNYTDSSQRRHRRNPKTWQTRQTSSSSRDVSPWEEDPPPRDPVPHTRSYHRERHESIGSCERRDSVGSRERRDSGSGRDRERTHERDRHRRRHHSRDDDDDEWSEDRGYGGNRRLSPCGRLGSRENRRDRAWPSEERWRSDDRGYSTVGRREGSRRRGEPPWQAEDPANRYSSTMGGRAWRRSGGSGGESDRRSRHAPVPSQHRARPTNPPRIARQPRRSPYAPSPSPPQTTSPPRSSRRHRFFDDFDRVETDSPATTKNGARFRFSNDFSEKDSPGSRGSPFDDDFGDTPSVPGKHTEALSAEKPLSTAARPPDFACFEAERDPVEDELSASPTSPRPRPTPALFEDDFSPEPRNGIPRVGEAEIIPEEDPHDLQEERTERTVGFRLGAGAPERRRSQRNTSAKARPRPDPDIKKSESVNIFARESDPFDGDDFFSRSAADRDSRRGDFAAFDNL